jgi:Photosynthetic reaction centre cytochrome C subunit
MRQMLYGALALGAWSVFSTTAAAQQPPGRQIPTPRNLLADMQSYTQALGVTCDFCHVAPANSGLPQPTKDIARTMIAMTRDLNIQVQLATGKAPVEVTRVECATCHRGVNVPRPLGQINALTLRFKGGDAGRRGISESSRSRRGPQRGTRVGVPAWGPSAIEGK